MRVLPVTKHLIPSRTPPAQVRRGVEGWPPGCHSRKALPLPMAPLRLCGLGWRLIRRRLAMAAVIVVIVILAIIALITAGRSMRVVQQYEKGIIYRFGRVLPG